VHVKLRCVLGVCVCRAIDSGGQENVRLCMLAQQRHPSIHHIDAHDLHFRERERERERERDSIQHRLLPVLGALSRLSFCLIVA